MHNPSRHWLAFLITFWALSGISLTGQTSTPQQTSPAAPSTPENQPGIPAPHTPRPNPDASGKYHAGDGVTAPQLLNYVNPEFPEIARKKKIKVTCYVSLTIQTDGTPYNVHVSSLDPNLSEKKMHKVAEAFEDVCTKSVQQYRFEPAKYKGNPIPVDLKVKIDFNVF